MKHNGFRLVSGGTDNHLMLVDVGAGPHRQGMPERAGRGRHHGEQEHHSLRNPLALPGQRHPPGHAGRDHARHERGRNGRHRGHDTLARLQSPPPLASEKLTKHQVAHALKNSKLKFDLTWNELSAVTREP
jgi:hypothetical protein